MRFKLGIVRSLAVAHDITVSLLAFLLSKIAVYGLGFLSAPQYLLIEGPLFVSLAAICLYASGINRGSWRYASIPDLLAIIQASTATVVLFTLAIFMISRAETLSRTSVILSWMLMMFLLGLGRIVYRLSREYGLIANLLGKRFNAKRVLLFPYNDTTEAFVRAVRRKKDLAIDVVGIIDDNSHYVFRELQGKRVLGLVQDIEQISRNFLAKERGIDELIVTDPEVTGERMTGILEACNNARIPISRLSSILDSTAGRSNEEITPKPVRLEDLLGRSENRIDSTSITRFVGNQTVLVTGAGGSIGSELCRQISSFAPRKLILVEVSEYNLYQIESDLAAQFPNIAVVPIIADIRDSARINAIFREHRPKVVFHAAALKHVPIVEHNPIEAVKTNVFGTAVVAEASIAAECQVFVLISTDKAVNPTNVMGATKRAAEAFCQSLDLSSTGTHFVAVRFGNVLGSSGSVVPRFTQQIARGGPVTVTHPEVERFFMTIPEAVRLVLHASSLDRQHTNTHRGKILVLDMGKPVKIMDLARRMIQLAGYRPGIDMKIEITGLRPGEKLFEELHGQEEGTNPITEHGFVVISPRVTDKAFLVRSLESMAKACKLEDSVAVLTLLKHIVPSYNHGKGLLPQAGSLHGDGAIHASQPSGETSSQET